LIEYDREPWQVARQEPPFVFMLKLSNPGLLPVTIKAPNCGDPCES
jgi:hypothetical protein